MLKGKVSAVMAVYNKEKYLRDAIESVLNQSYENIELILVNDASIDNSHHICLEYQSKYKDKVKYINNHINGGAGKSFQTGVESSDGEYIAFVGSDDVQIANRFSKCVKFLDNNRDIDMVFGNYETMDEEGNITGRKLIYPKDFNNKNIFMYQLQRNYLFSGLAMIRNSDYIQFDQKLRLSEDYELFLRLIFNGLKFNILDETMVYYRIGDFNISSNYVKSNQAVKYILKKYKTQDLFNKMEKDGISHKDINITLGVVSLIKEEYVEAIKFLEKVLDYDNHCINSYIDNMFYLANAYFYAGRFKDSLQLLRKLRKKNIVDPSIFNNLGVLEYKFNNIKEAEKLLEMALKMQPLYLDAKTNIENIEKNKQCEKITLKLLRKNVVHVDNYIL